MVSLCVLSFSFPQKLNFRFSNLLVESKDEDEDGEVEGEEEESDDESAEEFSDDEESPPEVMSATEEFVYWAKRSWEHYRKQLQADFVLVGGYCAIHPVIYDYFHDLDNRTPEAVAAWTRVCVKILLPDYKPGEKASEESKGKLIKTFTDEMDDFHNKNGAFSDMSWWTNVEVMLAFEFHQLYSYIHATVFEKIALRVCSKLLGTSEAECHWKANKAMKKGGQRARLGAEKMKKQATVAAAYSMEVSARRRARAQKAGELWCDEDFDNVDLGELCTGMIAPLEKKPARKVRCWYESWEKTQFKRGGNDYFAQLMAVKYGGLGFKDRDPPYKVGFTSETNCAVLMKCYSSGKNSDGMETRTEMQAVKGYGWFYGLLVMYEGFDPDVPYKEQENATYDIFELWNGDYYMMMRGYYEENEVPGIEIYDAGDIEEYVIPEDDEAQVRKHGIWVGEEDDESSSVEVDGDDDDE